MVVAAAVVGVVLVAVRLAVLVLLARVAEAHLAVQVPAAAPVAAEGESFCHFDESESMLTYIAGAAA